jgi:hypothetical protein
MTLTHEPTSGAERGAARSPGANYQQLLDNDTRP